MTFIKIGSKGDLVGDWQTFLRGEELYLGVVDEDFGQKTHDATIKFQNAHNLTADGVVGMKTIEKAKELGFGKSDNDLEFPPKPNFNPLVGNKERAKIFGEFQFKASPTAQNPEGISILGDWVSKNIVRVNLPALSKATGGKFGAMRWHKDCEYQLVKFFERLEKENLHTKILSYAGAFYPRFIRGSRTQLSNHSWGTAFDINVPQNGLNKTPALIGEKGSVRELVPIANECGFFWGGFFTRQDGMHFEIGKIINENL
jgi:hypothetical protein